MREFFVLQKEYFEGLNNIDTKFTLKILVEFTKEKISNFYIRFSKYVFSNSCFYTLLYIFQQLLLMFNPIVPFITEYIYKFLFSKSCFYDGNSGFDTKLKFISERCNFDKFYTFIMLIEKKIFSISNSFSKKFDMKKITFFLDLNEDIKFDEEIFDKILGLIENDNKIKISRKKIVHTKNLEIIDIFPYGFLKFYIPKLSILEKKKILDFYDFEISRAKGILQNEGFLKKSPPHLVEKEREKLEIFQKQKDKILNDYLPDSKVE